jgi:hypothetical protein
LWAFIDLKWRGSFRRLYAQLKRSGVAPLTLKIDLFDTSHYTEVILENSERIFHLEIGGQSEYVYELIAKLPDHNFPILSSLSLDPSFKRNELPQGFVEALPDVLFDGRLPNLRELKLESIAFPWRSLSGLTSLSLTQCNDSLATFDGLLEMIGLCPRLHTLKLDLIIPPPTPDQYYAAVDLPALAWLRLRDPVGSCEALLHHLHTPPAASVQILLHGVHIGADIRDLLVPIRKHVRAAGAKKLSLLQIDRTSMAYCTMMFFCDTAPHDYLERDSAHCPLLLNFHPTTEGALRQITSKVLKAIPSESITHLDACAGSAFAEVSWRALIKLLPALETVYLQVNRGAVNCVRALHPIETQNSQRQTFSCIRRLHIRILRPEPGDNTIVVLLAALEEYLQMCLTSGNGLEALEMEDQYYVLAGREERLARLFPLMKGEIYWNDVVYDPIKRKEEQAEWEAERRALAIEFGIEL